MDIPPVEAHAAVSVPKFCARCGARWEPQWIICPQCVRPEVSLPVGRTEHGRSISSAIGLYLSLLATSLLTIILMLAEAGQEAILDIVGSCLLTGIVVIWCLASWHAVRPGLVKTGHWLWYPAAIPIAGCTFMVALCAVKVLESLFQVESYSYTQPFFDAGLGWPTIVLVIAVIPGLFEELAFRGVVLSAMEKVLTLREALIVSAFMFMILHLAPMSFPHLLVVGVVLGFVRQRSGSLYPCMLIHFTHNLICVFAEV